MMNTRKSVIQCLPLRRTSLAVSGLEPLSDAGGGAFFGITFTTGSFVYRTFSAYNGGGVLASKSY